MEGSIDFKEIDESRKILGLGRAATLKEIKKAYKELVKKYHPDKSNSASDNNDPNDPGNCDERMKEINKAYEILMNYCINYRYPFTKPGKGTDDSYSEYMQGFNEDWMWGHGAKKVKKKAGKND